MEDLTRKLVDEIDTSFAEENLMPAINTAVEIIGRLAEAESRNIVADTEEATRLLEDKISGHCLWMYKPEQEVWRERFLEVLEVGIDAYLRTGHHRRMEFIGEFSAGQKKLRHLVWEIFPGEQVEDEYEFHGLRFDVYLPALQTAFEYDGEQHFRFVPVFHRTEADFHKQQKLDAYKAELCEKDGINLIRIRYDEDLTVGTVLKKALDLKLIMPKAE